LSLEAPFLAVLLRLMTFLLPSLHHLEAIDTRIAARFSKMASMIMECSGSHPLVYTEGMAFWEVLSKHQKLLPPHTGGVKYDEHPILCSIPFVMANLSPRTTPVHPEGIVKQSHMCHFSSPCIRSSLILIEALSASKLLIAEWTDMKAVAVLFAALEVATGSSVFFGETFHRSIAAPRESEVVYQGGDPTECDISSTLRLLPFLERASSRKSLQMLLRYVLLARSLVTGSSAAGNDDDDENDTPDYTVAAVVSSAIHKAADDIIPVLESSTSVRWQVKAIAIQEATTAIAEMVEQCRQDGIQRSASWFDPVKSRSECLEQCRTAARTKASLPESRLALHAEAVVTAACVTSTATVDQAELRVLQESAVYMLIEVINCFENAEDPDQRDVTLLNEYIPQISSCIKNALAAADDAIDGRTGRLFLSGCRALEAFVRTQVTEDASVLKRVIRPVLPLSDEVSFFDYDAEDTTLKTGKSDGDIRSSLLIKIGKLWALGSLWSGNATLMTSMLEPAKDEIGVSSTAFAIDGARLLIGYGLSLVGNHADYSEAQISLLDSGFSYDNIRDVDISVKSALAKCWAACASLGVSFLCEAIVTNDMSSARRDAMLVWLKKLVPLLFAGLGDSLGVATKASPSDGDVPEWAAGIDRDEVASRCLQGITALVSHSEILESEEKWQQEVQKIMMMLSEVVLTPTLSTADTKLRKMKPELVEMTCSFLAALSGSSIMAEDKDSTLLLSLLRPLDQLQRSSATLSEESTAMVASACLNAVGGIIVKPSTTKPLVDAMVALIIAMASNSEAPSSVKTAIRSLLKGCLLHQGIGVKEKSSIAAALARAGDWDAWSVVARLDEGAAAGQSLKVLQGVLLDSNRPEQQLAAIEQISLLLQSAPPPNPLVGRVVYGIGAEVLSLFQAYATQNVLKRVQSERPKACATCMKIALATYQQFASDAGEEELAGFLVVMFHAFIAILRYNGVPNHPPPQAGSDPAIGRMCAQAILHIARTTAVPFKTCMARMVDHDRAVLEFAVRAEMSGYATAAPAPAKKKLNLKSFKT
jgi:hypothetical protein